jgi:dynein heavy chain
MQDRHPYVCVVLQECARMNLLLHEIARSLTELEMGLQGALNMSDPMEALLLALQLDRVPASWEAKAYPSLKSLGWWFADLLRRVAQLGRWSDTLVTPVAVWISGLFNPMAYITAVLQAAPTTPLPRTLPLRAKGPPQA